MKEQTILEVYSHNGEVSGIYAIALAQIKHSRILESKTFAVKPKITYDSNELICKELTHQELTIAPSFEQLYGFIRHFFKRDVISHNPLARAWWEEAMEANNISLVANYKFTIMNEKIQDMLHHRPLSPTSLIEQIDLIAETYLLMSK